MQKTNNQPQTTDDAPPVLSMEDTAPPMMNDNPVAPMITTTQTTTTTAQDTPNTDSGSAAPVNDVVMPPIITTQKKKFAGGRVIATILGLFLLVGGLGAGILLVGQNQNIQEQAGCYSTCVGDGVDPEECQAICNMQDGSSGGVGDPGDEPPECSSGDDCGDGERCNSNGHCVADTTGGSGGSGSGGTAGSSCDGPSDCGSGYACVGSSPTTATCVLASTVQIPAGVTRCNGETQGVPESIGVCCSTGGTSYNYETGGSFVGDHWTTCAAGYNCQQDYGCVEATGGGGGGGGGTPPPTAPPAITAVCQNVKAYSPTWTLLTSTQLSALKSGSQVNLCVTGSATGGSFDKARFTINNVLQAETTTVRPSSTDFCQLYTIPATTTTFKVTAQIHHVTLDWK